MKYKIFDIDLYSSNCYWKKIKFDNIIFLKINSLLIEYINFRFRDAYYWWIYNSKDFIDNNLLNSLNYLYGDKIYKSIIYWSYKIVKKYNDLLMNINSDILLNTLSNKLEDLINNYNNNYKTLKSSNLILLLLELSIVSFLLNKIKNKKQRIVINNAAKNLLSLKKKTLNILLHYWFFQSIYIEKKNKTNLLLFEIWNEIWLHIPYNNYIIYKIKKYIKSKYHKSFDRNYKFIKINLNIND